MMKPVRASRLRATLLRLTSHATAAPAPPAPVPPSAPPGATPDGDPVAGRILVVEDTPISQRLALGILAKLGYRATGVGNGQQALDALARDAYAAVLMDCQMPEMDGFAATAEVRRLEGSGRHTPIIAITASAMPGERERCLAAGMDDYIAKPFRADELAAALHRWVPGARREGRPAPAASESPGRQSTGPVVLDAAAFASVGGRGTDGDGLLHEVARLFAEDTPQRLAAMRDAVATSDAERLARAAHALKGEAALIGAREMQALARELEELGREDSLGGAELVLTRLSAAYERAREAVAAMAAAPPAERLAS
jgi:CheY-like chemotaxis protein/HPt (histidine-containing phosphotransfer) domain-containing protein